MTITNTNKLSYESLKIENLFEGYTHNISITIDEMNKTVCLSGARNTIVNFYKFNNHIITTIKEFGYNVTYVFIG